MEQNINIEAQSVINNLLEQIKQLSLSNAILQARIQKSEQTLNEGANAVKGVEGS